MRGKIAGIARHHQPELVERFVDTTELAQGTRQIVPGLPLRGGDGDGAPVVLQGLLGLTCGHQRIAQVVQNGGDRRCIQRRRCRQGQRLAVAGYGGIGLPQPLQRGAQVFDGRQIIGLQGDSLAKRRHSLFEQCGVGQDIAEIEMPYGGWLEGQGPPVADGGQVEPPRPVLDFGESRMRLRIGAVDRQCGAKGSGRLFAAVQQQQHLATAAVGIGKTGTQCQRPLIVGQGIARPRLRQDGVAQVVLRLREGRLELQGTPQAGGGIDMAAQAVQGHAKIAVGIGKIRIHRQRLAVGDDRLLELARIAQDGPQVAAQFGVARQQRNRPPQGGDSVAVLHLARHG